ncbi:thymidylate synthase [Desulfosporosinus fructosivorans]
MLYTFNGNNANEVWTNATEVLLNCKQTSIESRIGKTKEILHVAFSISDPRERWVTQRVPPISIAFALAELIWILVGKDESDVINFWNPILPRYSGKLEKYHGAYGFRIKYNFGFDQMERAYYALKNQPNNRQTVISLWDPKKDFPNKKGQPADKDIPCNICSLLKIREQKLEWTQIMRSNDVFRGLPYNFVQFTSLQEILAGWLDVDIGSYTHFCDSLHLYSGDSENLSIINDDGLMNLDRLTLPKDRFTDVTNEIYQNMSIIVRNEISELELSQLSELTNNEYAYSNIMFIIAAYAARKLGFIDLEEELVKKCSNRLYVDMWCKWKKYRMNQGGQKNE